MLLVKSTPVTPPKITPVSTIATFNCSHLLHHLLTSICYFFLLNALVRWVLLSATRIRLFYLLNNCTSHCSNLLLYTAYPINYQLVLSTSQMR